MVKNLSACNAEDLGLIPGERNGFPLLYFYWRISWTEGVWWATVHGVTERSTKILALVITTHKMPVLD